jgi:hypothetical protein
MNRCETCRFWRRVTFTYSDDKLAPEPQAFGRCYRYAPRPHKSSDDFAWPKTGEDDFCGEYEFVRGSIEDAVEQATVISDPFFKSQPGPFKTDQEPPDEEDV